MQVVIVEDSDLVYSAMLEVLADCDSVNVVGRAVSEADAIRMIHDMAPDVVLLDLALQPGSGLEVLRTVRDQGCTARIFITSNQSSDALRLRCIQAGADAFFDKCSDLGALLAHLQAGAAVPRPMSEYPPFEVPANGRVPSELDEIVALAAEATGCPVAAVGLIGANRQWFVSRLGTAITSTSRHLSLCMYAATGNSVFEVPDTLADERFRLNPLTQAPFGFRYYAGAAIMLPGGRPVGALCVLDRKPRLLDHAQREALLLLARRAAVHIAKLQEEDAQPPVAHGVATVVSGLPDTVTELPGRSELLDAASRAMDEHADARIGVVSLGLDRLTRVNHAFGREGGDHVLREVASRMRAAFEPSVFVAKMDGDQFALLLPRLSGDGALLRSAEIASAVIGETMLVNGRPLRMRCSIGMAMSEPGVASSADTLLANAELAMQKAKRLGGNLCQAYACWMSTRAVDRVILEADLHLGIPQGQIVLLYQPQIELATGRMTGVEALVRWKHPSRGLLPPDMFVPLAEETGLIGELGACVLDMAVCQVARWREAGLQPPLMAVNVSALQLTPQFPALVAETLRRHAVEAAALEIEITESVLAHPDLRVADLLLQLRQSGVALAIDDFGVGYSSLAALSRLPFTTLKIDRSFIIDLDASNQHAAVVGAVVAMAHSLGMQTVGEGVEDAAHHACLRSLGCDRAQGFVYSRPIEADAVAALLVRDAMFSITWPLVDSGSREAERYA